MKNTFGWARMEILGTMVNLIFFCALLFSLAVHCIQTMAHAEHEQVQPQEPSSLIIFGIIGIIMYFILQISAGGECFMNFKGYFYNKVHLTLVPLVSHCN